MCVLTIYSATAVSTASCQVTQPKSHSCNACKCALIFPNTIVSLVINSGNVLMGTLLLGWLLSMNSFSRAFVVLDFFWVVGDSLVRDRLRWSCVCFLLQVLFQVHSLIFPVPFSRQSRSSLLLQSGFLFLTCLFYQLNESLLEFLLLFLCY